MWLLSLTNQTMKLKRNILMFLCSCLIGTVTAADRSKHVILITIDGMRSEMKRDGLFVERIKGITPTATYPSHITIVTGVEPVQHRIYYNSPFTENRPGNVSYWYADSIKATTIWDSANQNGLIVASLFWPVSVGAKSIIMYLNFGR